MGLEWDAVERPFVEPLVSLGGATSRVTSTTRGISYNCSMQLHSKHYPGVLPGVLFVKPQPEDTGTRLGASIRMHP